MKKMMIMAGLIAVAVAANAQNRKYDYGTQRQTPYENQPSYQTPYPNQPTYQTPYPNQNAYPQGNFQGERCAVNVVDELLRSTQMQLESGMERGMITTYEAKTLWHQFEFIKEKKFQMERNGYLSGYEKEEILADLRDLNARITHEKFDGDRYGRNNGRGDWGRHGGDFGEHHRF